MQLGRDRIQISSWKSSTVVANLVPFPAGQALSIEIVEKALNDARSSGFEAAYTAAMTPPQVAPFVACGFKIQEELHLLHQPLEDLATPPREHTRRGHRLDWDDVLALDELAFSDPFWKFDRASLTDAMRATPRHRFQVTRTTPVAGYHVTGLATNNAYIQRVAVHPDAQGGGHGRKLVEHALYWGWRHGARMAYVNTQLENERARNLYQRCGFELAEHRLQVLHRTL